MRHNRLRLVVPEEVAEATDDATEYVAVRTRAGADVGVVLLLNTDEGSAPDDAA